MKFHLLTKMILFILLPALAGQALIAGLSYQRSSRAMQEQLENHMALMVKMQADGLLHVYEGLVREMQELGESGPVRDLQTAHGKVDGATMTALRQRASAYLAEVAERHPVVSLIGITDATGRITAHSVARSIGTSRASKGYFQRAMKGISSTEDVKSETTGEFRTFFCIPILGGADGKTPIGSMYAAIHNYKLARMSINSVAVGKSGLSFVYNTDGVVVMHPDAVNIGRNDGDLEHVRRLVQGSGAVAVRFTDADGERLAFSAVLPRLNWVVVMEVAWDEVFAPFIELRNISILLFVACGGIIGLFILLLSRNISAMLGAGARVVEEAAKGNFVITPERKALFDRARRRHDEIGIIISGLQNLLENTLRLLKESEDKTEAARRAEADAHAASEKAAESARYAELARQDGMHVAAQRLTEVVDVVSSAVEHLSSRMEEASTTALASATHLSEAATAMNEMNVTTQEVARNASDASGMSVKTREHAAQGSAVVQEAERGIQQVQEQMQALKDDILRLNTHAQSISRVMNVISDIADQTNLLALNAAIEAARAGDAGRGFAVVADEVRKLAEKTMSATAEVSQAIVTIQQNTASTMNSVDATVARMEEATVQAHASGEALTRIVSDVETTADEVRAIAAAGEEQSAASEEINRSIVQVSNMSEHTAQAIQDAAGAVTSLKEQTDRLRELIARLQRS